jgi:hypothetical protein
MDEPLARAYGEPTRRTHVTYGRNLRNLALVLLLSGSACGDDDGSPADEDGGGSGRGSQEDSGGPTPTDDGGGQAGNTADAASPDGGGGSAGTSMTTVDSGLPDEDAGIEQCGATQCGQPMCCADPFVSMCGLQISERACLPPQMMGAPAMSDPRCPGVTFGSFMIASCCTADNRCGINAQMAGMGCVSLEQVIMFTMGMGGPGGSVMFPEPQACE